MATAFPDDNTPQHSSGTQLTSASGEDLEPGAESHAHNSEELSPEYVQAQEQLMQECQQLKDQISNVSMT